jgi:restriction endonuclease Mrr
MPRDSVTFFRVGELYTNDQIRFALDLENLGGIRPSIDSRKNLRHVAILSVERDAGHLLTENPYMDRIEGDVLTYTAQGRSGDQQLTGRNKRLIEQYTTPVPFYGFINTGKQTYRFLGLLELLRHYQEVQADTKNTLRKVWVFELRIHAQPDIVPILHARDIMSEITDSRLRRPAEDVELDATVSDSADDLPQGNLLQAETIRHQLLQYDPHKFEWLIKQVMEKSGFVRVNVTRASGDGGIDLNAYVSEKDDFFGKTYVQAQVKRWRHAVGSIEINNFRGALSSTAKGMFFTTSVFTRAAIVEAYHEAKPSISLIDGHRLSTIIIRNGVQLEQN